MSVEQMVAAAAATKVMDQRLPLLQNLVMTRQELGSALMEAYLNGLEKGRDLERMYLVKLVRDCPFWPSRADKGKLMHYMMKAEEEEAACAAKAPGSSSAATDSVTGGAATPADGSGQKPAFIRNGRS